MAPGQRVRYKGTENRSCVVVAGSCQNAPWWSTVLKLVRWFLLYQKLRHQGMLHTCAPRKDLHPPKTHCPYVVVWCAHVCMCMWRRQDNLRCHSLEASPLLCLRKGDLLAWNASNGLVGLLATPRGSSVSTSPE